MDATLTELRRDTTKLIRAVQQGETVQITDYGRPVAKIEPAYAVLEVSIEEFRKHKFTAQAILDAINEGRE